MQCLPQAIPDVKLLIPDVFGDSRGFFQETFRADRYRQMGIDVPFVQDNWSRSVRGTLRGLHYQLGRPQAKLVWVVRGTIFDVAVDIRRGSPTFGQSVSAVLSEGNHHQFFVPAGFAHGFCVISDEVDFFYKCSDVYSQPDERGILWSDPSLNIAWPVQNPLLSGRDQAMRRLAEIGSEDLPVYVSPHGTPSS
jgi:dTDP-4-dehydrorhamnose 3,5-epimerase